MKTLKNFEFKSAAGGHSSYDWDKLLDGGIYQLVEGEDYECKTQTFAMLARKNAAKKERGVRVSKNETGVVIQGFDLDAAALKALRAKKAEAESEAA